MKIVFPYAGLLDMLPDDAERIMKKIEACGRVAYKSENRIKDGSAEEFVRSLIKMGHESVLEHASLTAKFIVDRGISHELVRHRIASFTQESTRYCNYSQDKFGNEITVVAPGSFTSSKMTSRTEEDEAYAAWETACKWAERAYFYMLECGVSPQIARNVLPNSLKTEVVMTANLREWRHFFRLRCSSAAHPQMQEVSVMLLRSMYYWLPAVFEDIYQEVLAFD